jgi:general secretion pathway protein L
MASLKTLQTGTSEFLTWWVSGLILLVPESLREKILHGPDRITIRSGEDNSFTLNHYRSDKEEQADGCSFNSDNPRERSEAIQWLRERADTTTETSFLIPVTRVLHKTLTLPPTSEKDLHDILGFEMDRQTPFTNDQVYYDCRIADRDKKSGKLLVDLFVLPRDSIATELREINSWGTPLRAINVTNDAIMIDRINLLPVTDRPVKQGHLDSVISRLIMLSFMAFLAALYLPVLHQQQSLAGMEEQVNQMRIQAREVQPLINERDSMLAKARFLTAKQQERVPVIVLLSELTRILPDDTWLNRLVLQNEEIQIHGEYDTNTPVLQLLESSVLFHNARFRSPVTYNNTTNKNNFHISVVPGKETGS